MIAINSKKIYVVSETYILKYFANLEGIDLNKMKAGQKPSKFLKFKEDTSESKKNEIIEVWNLVKGGYIVVDVTEHPCTSSRIYSDIEYADNQMIFDKYDLNKNSCHATHYDNLDDYLEDHDDIHHDISAFIGPINKIYIVLDTNLNHVGRFYVYNTDTDAFAIDGMYPYTDRFKNKTEPRLSAFLYAAINNKNRSDLHRGRLLEKNYNNVYGYYNPENNYAFYWTGGEEPTELGDEEVFEIPEKYEECNECGDRSEDVHYRELTDTYICDDCFH
ncbi:MAG: hypothetical protein LBM02_09705 [Lachnospiraceae bacterium]|jgi:hypothetical protein|nr:hypothetical protein [Lachnospiraceae bacterium]